MPTSGVTGFVTITLLSKTLIVLCEFENVQTKERNAAGVTREEF